MAGSYKHCVDEDGNILGPEEWLIDNLGDAWEAAEEMILIIRELAGGDSAKIVAARNRVTSTPHDLQIIKSLGEILKPKECSTCHYWDKLKHKGNKNGQCIRLSQPNFTKEDRSADLIASDTAEEEFITTFTIATWSDFYCSLFEPAAEAEAEAA